VWLDFNSPNEQAKKAPPKDDYDSEEDPLDQNRFCKSIRLKKHRLREDVFAYLRATLMQKDDHKDKKHILISSPVDAEFELLVVACAINLLQGLLTARFSTSSEEDLKIMANADISMRVRFAVQHRLDCKTILESNIRYYNILMRILAKILQATNTAVE
jgi:hypothetical protein